jgi:23S rRNA pseudouridine1911/1915/1917 synthase
MNEPAVFAETPEWAILVKPHDMPSAPLVEGEGGTLLEWFLQLRPEARIVRGKKTVECGLLHRLDTGTEGLVLVAKTQAAYDNLSRAQKNGLIVKTYRAICSRPSPGTLPFGGKYPARIESRFRAYGPGRKEVRPLFPGMRGYEDAGEDYQTLIEGTEPISGTDNLAIRCVLVRGYRHQVRAHLAFAGFPILGDRLYNSAWKDDVATSPIPLQLSAIGLSFTDPATGLQAVFSLPLPDRMTP